MKTAIETEAPSQTTLIQPSPEQPLVIKSLDQIAALHDEPIVVRVHAYGKPLEFRGRRLRASEQQEIKRILEKAIPPRVDGQYNFDDPAFLETKDTAQRQARAKCLCLAYPDLFACPESVKDLAAMQAHVESRKLSDELLEVLYGAAVFTPVSLMELVGFSSGNSSPKS